MKRIPTILAFTLMAGSLAAGPIDGKWKAETELQGKKASAGTMTTVFELRSEGTTLSGKVTTGAGRRDVTADVQNGRIDGDRFSFTTVHQTRRGAVKTAWEGTVAGDELKGTRMVEGRKRKVEFTARRQP